MSDLIDRGDALEAVTNNRQMFKAVLAVKDIPSVEAIPTVTILAEADRQEKIGYTQTADVLRRLADPDQCDGNWRADK